MKSNDASPSSVKVWDPLVRVFHWSLMLFFLLAFITEDDWMKLHVWAGYAVAMLIAFRLVWGVVGTRTARFRSFVKSPRLVMRHLREMLLLRPSHYLGHNPAAAAMVVTLLLSISLVAFTGMVLIATEGQGPLAGTFFAGASSKVTEDVHEFFANLTLVFVFWHLTGVGISSLLEGENLTRSMVTGRKKARQQWVDVNPDGELGNEP